ncbi:MAG: TVP38/TMEM64 family protein [Clostridia bacterium]|nr:TVP38/TMEM64 family protein [Clostridia bacterium]
MTDRNLKRKKILSVVGIVLFVAVLAVLSVLFSKPILEFVKDPVTLRQWVDEKGFLARIAFVGIVVLQVIIAFIPGEPVEIAAGLAFGVWEGTLLSLIGAAIGSCLVFLFVRKWGVRVVELFFPPDKHGKLKFLKTEKRADTLLFLLLFIPGTPKDLISYFAGLTPVKFTHFLWITLAARIPSVITSTWGGDAIIGGNWFLVAGIFIGTGLVSLLGLWLFERITARRSGRNASSAKAPEENETSEKPKENEPVSVVAGKKNGD